MNIKMKEVANVVGRGSEELYTQFPWLPWIPTSMSCSVLIGYSAIQTCIYG